jgi:hypothetical protein
VLVYCFCCRKKKEEDVEEQEEETDVQPPKMEKPANSITDDEVAPSLEQGTDTELYTSQNQ